MRKYLRETSFKDHIDVIAQTFEKAGIVDYATLQNAPVKVGHIGSIDIYQLVAELNEVIPVVDKKEELEKLKSVIEKKPKKASLDSIETEEEKGEEVK